MAALTTKDFIERAKLAHGNKYDYSKVNYVRINDKVEIICPEHGSFMQSYNLHIYRKNGCPQCGAGGRLTTEKFIKRATLVHGNKYDYSKVDYKSVKDKVEIICPEHGSFMQSIRLHVERKNGCSECGYKLNKQKSIDQDEFIERSRKIHGDKYDYSKSNYLGPTSPIDIICSIHGKFTIKSSHLHITNKNGCQQCALDSRRLTKEEFIQKSKKLYGEYYIYDKVDYNTLANDVIIICPKHGEQKLLAVDHLRVGCWFCKRNRSQDIWLDEIGILNSKETRQVRLRVNDRLFVVDGFVDNTVYLFHGDYWHGNPKLYEQSKINTKNGKSFGELYRMTIEYETILKDAGYSVVSIWEYDWLQSNPDKKKYGLYKTKV